MSGITSLYTLVSEQYGQQTSPYLGQPTKLLKLFITLIAATLKCKISAKWAPINNFGLIQLYVPFATIPHL